MLDYGLSGGAAGDRRRPDARLDRGSARHTCGSVAAVDCVQTLPGRYLGWSRDRAREYFARHAPAQSLAEVDRYIARPGQALAYKLGQLKILELRRKAEKTLGARFDIREFHDVVLRNGTLPLDLLEEQVNTSIASKS